MSFPVGNVPIDPVGRAAKGVDLRPFDYRGVGFESRRGHGCSSLVFVVCSVGSNLCNELIARSEESYWV